MFDSIKRQPKRRVVKVGIAAAAVVAAGGAFLASQAGAATVGISSGSSHSDYTAGGKNLMIYAPNGVGCATVWAKDKNSAAVQREYDFQSLGWKPGTWNSTGISVGVDYTVGVGLTYGRCNSRLPDTWGVYGVTYGMVNNKWGDAFLDASQDQRAPKRSGGKPAVVGTQEGGFIARSGSVHH